MTNKRYKVIKEIPGTGFKAGDILDESYKVELSPKFLMEYFQEVPYELTCSCVCHGINTKGGCHKCGGPHPIPDEDKPTRWMTKKECCRNHTMRASKYGVVPSCSSEFSPGFCCPQCPDRPNGEKVEEDKPTKPNVCCNKHETEFHGFEKCCPKCPNEYNPDKFEVSEELQEIRTMLRNWEERGLNMTGYSLPNILRAFLDYLENKEREEK